MPGGISSIEMAKEILKIKPQALILLATGYEAKAEALKNTASKSENIVTVLKPYDINEVPDLIASMINSTLKD